MIQRPRGTSDYIDEDFSRKRNLENQFTDFFSKRGYFGIETPLFEQRDLFVRSVGDQTDIVQKELFDLEQKSDNLYALRPEITAGIIRALSESGFLKSKRKPINVLSFGPCFRYEKPQKGRKRQFNQLDLETIGKRGSLIDGEFIASVAMFLKSFGIDEITISISTFGSQETKNNYALELKNYFTGLQDSLCPMCKMRSNKNAFRVLDCKDPSCKEASRNAPEINLKTEEKTEFDQTVEIIRNKTAGENVLLNIDKTLVRGLDYYTGIVFEISLKSDDTRAGSIGGGGRYDGLINELSGTDLPALGVGLGVERILETIK